MNFPEQELFSVEDVAARWGKSVTYVQDLTRRRLLPMNRGFLTHETNNGKRQYRLKCFVQRKDLEAFECEASVVQTLARISIKEYMDKHHVSEKTVRRDIKAKKRDAIKIHGRWMIAG